MSVLDRAPFPPYACYPDFLGQAQVGELLSWAIANRERFKAAPLAGGIVDPDRRHSQRLLDMGSVRPWFEQHMRDHKSAFFAETGTKPFDVEFIELEIVAHGDGAHFAAHTDMPVGRGRAPLGGDGSERQDRLLSAVYYFHREPKAFTGGQLRLFRLGAEGAADDHIDLEPRQNSLVVFPSWARHEVRRVCCPSEQFEDSRFAINCWFCKTAF